MSEPLVFMFHHGTVPAHARWAAALLKPVKGSSRLIWAGSEYPAECAHMEFVDTSKITDSRAFCDINYTHETTNSREWELRAIWRWFVLEQTLDGHRGPVICLDSDVFMFSDPAEILHHFTGEFGFGADRNPPIAFFRTPELIHEFGDFLREAMTSPSLHASIRTTVGRLLQSFGGGLQEMGFIYYFCQKARARGRDIADVSKRTDAGIYDFALAFNQPNCGSGVHMDDFGKVVVWDQGTPHFLCAETGKRIPALSLHVQGTTKKWFHRWLPKQ